MRLGRRRQRQPDVAAEPLAGRAQHRGGHGGEGAAGRRLAARHVRADGAHEEPLLFQDVFVDRRAGRHVDPARQVVEVDSQRQAQRPAQLAVQRRQLFFQFLFQRPQRLFSADSFFFLI